jgi:ABC-type sugar transport system ATPase subunit
VAAIALERIERHFPNGHAALRGIDLRIADGEFVVLVGPSGCGKSTLLRLIAGLDTPTGGRIRLDGVDVTDAAPQSRDLAMVFQSYALYPHMTVRENLAYGLRVRRTDAATIARRIRTVAEVLGLNALLDRRPAQLSGGQRQRVALGRALVREPKAFLLDEPLSNLDPALRAQARAELLRLHRQLHATVVYVTHDQEEAMTLGSRVAVLREGRIEQLAAPLELYDRPATTFVAQFIGIPPMNLLHRWPSGIEAPSGVTIGIRPQDVVIDRGGKWRAMVDVVEPRGHDAVVHLRASGHGDPVVVAVVQGTPPPAGAEVGLSLPPHRLHLFDANGNRRGR